MKLAVYANLLPTVGQGPADQNDLYVIEKALMDALHGVILMIEEKQKLSIYNATLSADIAYVRQPASFLDMKVSSDVNDPVIDDMFMAAMHQAFFQLRGKEISITKLHADIKTDRK